MSRRKKIWSVVGVFIAITASSTIALADTQSDMERLFGKKIADQTSKPKSQWQKSTPAPKAEETKNLFKVENVTVEGIRIGDRYLQAVEALRSKFTVDSILQKENTVSEQVKFESVECRLDYSNSNSARFDGRSDQFDICKGSYRTFKEDRRSVLNTFSMSLGISDKGVINSIRLNSRRWVADSDAACTEILNKKIDQYVEALGEGQKQIGSNWRDHRNKKWSSPDYTDYFHWNSGCERSGLLKEEITVKAGSVK